MVYKIGTAEAWRELLNVGEAIRDNWSIRRLLPDRVQAGFPLRQPCRRQKLERRRRHVQNGIVSHHFFHRCH